MADPEAYWSAPADELFARLGSRRTGLSAVEAAEALERLGPNALHARGRGPTLEALVSQIRSPLVWLLVFAAVVSGVAREWTDAGVVLGILLFGGLLGFHQERRAGLAVQQLRTRIATRVRVLRGGVETSVLQAEIVPGDVVLLAAGSLVPADGVLLEAKDFFVNQAVLTGETYPAEKSVAPSRADAGLAERTNAVFLGTSVRSGTASALVVRTGAGTAYGGLAERLVLHAPETEFERGIRRFGYLLTRIMIALVFVVFAASVLREKPAIESLLFSIALAVGLAPEMLPAILAINLSHGARAMATRGVIVRHLSSIENFGSMDVLCTDKTGTLTEGSVRLDGAFGADGAPSDDVLRLAAYNSRLELGLANPLDDAIREAAGDRWDTPEKVDEIPYDFTRKRMTVVVRAASKVTMVTKGAFERVLEICTDSRRGGATEPLDDASRAALSARFSAWSEGGIRVLGVATRELDPGRGFAAVDEAEMTFEGFLCFADPPKAGVDRVVRELQGLGVTIKIITGDHRDVARHVAGAIGLDVSGLLTGRELAALRDEALWHLAERTTIFAEVDPNQKERILVALQKAGHVVGYLGDGINDAPALHAADVGISVDTAADVAREAADFVLLRHDLETLRAGIEEGRATFANTMKYVLVTESANLGNMISMAAASVALPFLPLLAPQVLLNNFLSDVPAMTLARDGVDPEMVLKPRRWDIAFIRRFMIAFGLLSSAFDVATFVVLAAVLHSSPEAFRTGWFIESLLTELAVALVVRTRRAAWRSRPSRGLAISTAVVAVVALGLPYTSVGAWFSLVPLPLATVGLLVGITLAYVVSVELLKHAIMTRIEGVTGPRLPRPRAASKG